MTDTNNLVDIDSLLDATLDDLADVPEFKPFPKGTHKCTLNIAQKDINGHAAMEWKLTGQETIELADPEDTPIKAGDVCSGAFILTKDEGGKKVVNELAQGQFKELLKPFTAHFGTATNRDTVEAMNGCTVVATMGQRAGKKGSTSEGKFFPTIEAIAVL